MPRTGLELADNPGTDRPKLTCQGQFSVRKPGFKSPWGSFVDWPRGGAGDPKGATYRRADDRGDPRAAWQVAYRDILPSALLDGLSISERERSWEALVAGAGDDWLTLVAECEAALVGFCAIATPGRDPDADEGTAEITAIYVAPDSWRRGTGNALMESAVNKLRDQGWRAAVLWVLPENEPALSFYDRHGFEVEEGIEKHEERSGRPVIRLRVRL